MPLFQNMIGQKPAAEYSVYVYFDPEQENSNSRWEMKGVTDCANKAICEAKDYFKSCEFCKVEIKEKYFDSKAECHIDRTFKTYKTQDFMKSSRGKALIVFSLMTLATIAYALTI